MIKRASRIEMYMPLLGEDQLPPRAYMFQVLEALNNKLFNRIMCEAALARKKILSTEKNCYCGPVHL